MLLAWWWFHCVIWLAVERIYSQATDATARRIERMMVFIMIKSRLPDSILCQP